MRSGGVPQEDFGMQNSILTVPRANFWFLSGQHKIYDVYKILQHLVTFWTCWNFWFFFLDFLDFLEIKLYSII